MIPDSIIVRVAKSLAMAAEQNHIAYQRPSVHMLFTGVKELDAKSADIFRSLGCTARCGSPGQLAQSFESESAESTLAEPLPQPHTISGEEIHTGNLFLPTLNLDVSAIISDLCHYPGQTLCEDATRVAAIVVQQKEELEKPLLHTLYRLFCAAERIIMAETAYVVLENIVQTLVISGGGTTVAHCHLII